MSRAVKTFIEAFVLHQGNNRNWQCKNSTGAHLNRTIIIMSTWHLCHRRAPCGCRKSPAIRTACKPSTSLIGMYRLQAEVRSAYVQHMLLVNTTGHVQQMLCQVQLEVCLQAAGVRTAAGSHDRSADAQGNHNQQPKQARIINTCVKHRPE